jgi:hypothetical protein
MTTDRPRSSLAVWLTVLAIPFLPVAYVLSFGPATWLASQGFIGLDTHAIIYWPLLQLCHFSAWREFLKWYADLWQ